MDLQELYDGIDFFDDLSGSALDKDLMIEARRLEMEFFRRMGVYTKVHRSEVAKAGAKTITTRWVDTNKGDLVSPNYRARLVGREMKTDNRLDLFAGTPPLEALKMVLSKCASNQRGRQPYRVMTIDVKRTYFYAAAKRSVFIEIPAEDRVPGDENMVGRLNLSLYGTRDAAQNWTEEYTRTMVRAGFKVGKASPCDFYHEEWDVAVTVHGDDFTACGPESALKTPEKALTEKYEIKVEILGPEKGHKQEVRVLNRVLRWTPEGIEYEPDQRHAELVIKELGLE